MNPINLIRLHAGGIAGGDKYMHKGIMFKLTKDPRVHLFSFRAAARITDPKLQTTSPLRSIYPRVCTYWRNFTRAYRFQSLFMHTHSRLYSRMAFSMVGSIKFH